MYEDFKLEQANMSRLPGWWILKKSENSQSGFWLTGSADETNGKKSSNEWVSFLSLPFRSWWKEIQQWICLLSGASLLCLSVTMTLTPGGSEGWFPHVQGFSCHQRNGQEARWGWEEKLARCLYAVSGKCFRCNYTVMSVDRKFWRSTHSFFSSEYSFRVG